jgi:Uma2 family endonuclease
MVTLTHTMTIEEFEAFALLPENLDRRLEYVNGEAFELRLSHQSSVVSASFGAYLLGFVRPRDLGFVTGAGGGYRIAGSDFIPNCAFISKQKLPKPSKQFYYSESPDLAVEVLSPSNTHEEMRLKIVSYLDAGTLLWLVDVGKRRVEVYTPGQPPKVLGIDDILDGGDVLPGFTLPLKEVFARLD